MDIILFFSPILFIIMILSIVFRLIFPRDMKDDDNNDGGIKTRIYPDDKDFSEKIIEEMR